MNRWIQGVFKNKAAVVILVVMTLGLGVFSYFKLPMEFLPEADNPQVTVSVVGPGYNAATMEREVTTPLEQALSAIKGKTDMFSTSGDGYSKLDLNFDAKTDMKEAKAEVEKAAASVQMPERVSKPYVIQYNTSMIPISFLSLTFKDGLSDADKAKAEQRAVDAFRSIDGAGQVELSGKSSPSVTIVPDAARLAAKGVPAEALYGVLQGRAASAAVGEAVIDGSAVNLNVSGELGSAEQIAALPVAPGVKLSDVAAVSLSDDKESVSRINGKDALMLVVSKGANANAVSVGKEVAKTAESLMKEDDSMELKVILSTSDQVVHSVDSMMREVLMGALFATIIILLFMRNLRATLVTIVSIPLSLGLTLYLLDLSGISLNILTLGGVAVAVGRLVDDSIVVIENIFRRLQKERFSVSLVIDATREVSTAITASTLTTVAVFLPMGLLRGSLQSFLLPFALTVTYSLLSSLLVALTVIPLMSAALLKRTEIAEHRPSQRFGRFLEWNLRHKWLPLVIALVLLIGSIATYVNLPKGAIDSSDASNVNVTLSYSQDTPVQDVLENGKKLESYLVGRDDIEWVTMDMGNSADGAMYGSLKSPTQVDYTIQMKEKADAEKVIADLKAERAGYPGAELNASAASLMFGGGGSQIFVDIVGSDADTLAKTADEVVAGIKPIKDVLKVASNQQERKTVYTLQVDPAVAKAGDIAGQLQGMLNAVPVGSIVKDGQQLPVTLAPLLKPGSAADLDALTVGTDEGPKKLSQIAKWVKSDQPTEAYHKDGKTYIRVSVTAEPAQLSIVGGKISDAMKKITPAGDTKIYVGGASADQNADFASLFMMMLVSIGIVYLIMVFTFKTLRAPLAIMASILFVPIGAVLGLIVSGVTPDFTAIFGVVMLIGIVVTNAIVLIDRVKKNEARMSIREAIVEAAVTRMRPILMTAIATVCAMLPLVFGTSESGSIVSQSLAIVVIGGLVVATLLTLVLVPCVYELLYFRKAKRQRLAAQAGAAA